MSRSREGLTPTELRHATPTPLTFEDKSEAIRVNSDIWWVPAPVEDFLKNFF